jgi:hypothetical protein
MSLNYQFILISINEVRKNKTLDLLNTFNSSIPIYNLKATTPIDDEPFINCIKNTLNFNSNILLICCASP